jgi:hypothetical protein
LCKAEIVTIEEINIVAINIALAVAVVDDE